MSSTRSTLLQYKYNIILNSQNLDFYHNHPDHLLASRCLPTMKHAFLLKPDYSTSLLCFSFVCKFRDISEP